MPPNPSCTKEEIIEVAFGIVQKNGMASLTARNVAEELGLSTRPIYFYFSSMEELRQETINKALDILYEYATKPYTKQTFLNTGAGLVFYARDYKSLFRLLFMENNKYKDIADKFLLRVRNLMNDEPYFANVTQEERDDLQDRMWIFTHGLATLICAELIDNDSDSFIISTLRRTGDVVVDEVIPRSSNKKNMP